MWILVLVLVIPLALTLYACRSVRALGYAKGLLDQPGGRKLHEAAKPRLGGVGIYLGFTVTVIAGFLLAPALAQVEFLKGALPQVMAALAQAWRVKTPLIGLVAGGTLMFLVGLVDDVLGARFPTWLKFAGQSAAAAIAVACGIQVDFAASDVANAALSFLWIVGISNAFNLLDNMDGLAAGVAGLSAVIFLFNAAELGEVFICLVLTALIGSVLGFLRYNFHPSTLFMGDAGALFLGFTLASLTILERYLTTASSSLFPILMPPLVLAVPLLDTCSVIWIRVREGRPVYVGDRCHLSHRLVSCGLTELQAVLFLYVVTLGVGMGTLQLAHASFTTSLWVLVDSALLGALTLWVIGIGRRLGTTTRASQIPNRLEAR